MPNLFIIAGCNGAGKTTASFNILPEILNCHEFVNADIIAKGLSPFAPEKAAVAAGRILLERVAELMEAGKDFAIEDAINVLCESYEVAESVAANDAQAWVKRMQECGLIEN